MGRRRLWKSLLLSLVIASTLMVSAAAVSPAHGHLFGAGGRCDICAAAHLPQLQPPLPVRLHVLTVSDWKVPVGDAGLPAEPVTQPRFSRGPPA